MIGKDIIKGENDAKSLEAQLQLTQGAVVGMQQAINILLKDDPYKMSF